RDHAEPVVVAPACRCTANSKPPADGLPLRAVGSRPDELRVLGLQPLQPWQRRFHAANGLGRGRGQPCRRSLLADQVTELHDHLRPGVEVTLHPRTRETAEHCRRLLETLTNVVPAPVTHVVPSRWLLGLP